MGNKNLQGKQENSFSPKGNGYLIWAQNCSFSDATSDDKREGAMKCSLPQAFIQLDPINLL